MSDVLIKMTGLWERERRGNPGSTYWAGRLGAAKILVFKNSRKESPDDPDYNMFVTEPSPRPEGKPPPRRSPGDALLRGAGREPEPIEASPIPGGGDELPF
jgi:hypothetical protein